MATLPVRRRLMVSRVWIDPDECLVHTLCVPETSGLIEHNRERDVFVVKEKILKRTQQELKELLEASSVCPMSAFRVTLLNGQTYNIQAEQWILDAISQGDYEWA